MSADLSLHTRVGGLLLSNPVICGAGEHVMTRSGIQAALASGAAGVIAKSVNESVAAARQLDFADYAAIAPDGEWVSWTDADAHRDSLLCRSGLAQVSPESWFPMLGELDRRAARTGQFVAASLVLGDPVRAGELAGLAGASGVRVLELNVGAPHAAEATSGAISALHDPAQLAAVVDQVKRACGGHLWVKLGCAPENHPMLARAAQEAGADAVTLMGRFMALVPDLDSLLPTLGTSAAYGGRWALPITCRALALTRRATGQDYPLIGTNGARTGLDVARLVLSGASAVELASVVMQHGFAALAAIRSELAVWLQEHHLTIQEMIGLTADRTQRYTDRAAVPERWRAFVPGECLS
jgi:dihydroorotate dehydrogenase (NAD+) catalytic subunit